MLLLSVAAFSALYGRTALSPLQEAVRASLGLSDNQMALVQGPAMALPPLLAAVPLGMAVDRLSRVRLVMALAWLSAAGALLTAVAPGFSVLAAARCLNGLAAPATWIAVLSLAADLCPPARRGRAVMALAIAGCLGISAAFASGGWLLSLIGGSGSGWRRIMLCQAAGLALVAVSSLLLREPSRSERRLRDPTPRQSYAELWAWRKEFAPLLAAVVLVGVADGAAMIWGAPSFIRHFGLSAGQAGGLMGLVVLVSGVAGPVIGGGLADAAQRTSGPRLTMSLMAWLAFATVPTGLFAVAPGAALAGGLLIGFMSLGSALNVGVPALVAVVLPNELRGLCMGMLSTASLLFGFGVAPLTVSLLSSALGGAVGLGPALSLVCVCISAAGALFFALGAGVFPAPDRPHDQQGKIAVDG